MDGDDKERRGVEGKNVDKGGYRSFRPSMSVFFTTASKRTQKILEIESNENEFNLREEKKMAPDVNVIGNAHRKQINAEEGEYIYISLSHTHE